MNKKFIKEGSFIIFVDSEHAMVVSKQTGKTVIRNFSGNVIRKRVNLLVKGHPEHV